MSRHLLSLLPVLVALGAGLDAASIQANDGLSILRSPSDAVRVKEFIEEQRQSITKQYKSGDHQEDLLTKVNSLLDAMEQSSSGDKTEDYLKFQAFLMNMSSRIEGELGNFGESLVMANRMVKFSEEKLEPVDVELAEYILESMREGLMESFEDLRSEFKASQQADEAKELHKNLLQMLPSEQLDLLDEKSRKLIDEMRQIIGSDYENLMKSYS